MAPTEALKSKPRIKAWQPKVKTGCRTCKRRKIKCDEGKPRCQRCLKAKLVCDGYDAVPKTWIFENPQPKELSTPESTSGSSSTSSSASSRRSSASSLVTQSRPISAGGRCKRCLQPDYDCSCPEGPTSDGFSVADLAKRTARLGLQPSGRYKTSEEQYFFKYFMEIAAVSVSRSDISGTFWLDYFPKAAFHHDAIRDALLSTATNFQSVSKQIILQIPVQEVVHPRSIVYENRAMQALVREPPSVEAMLTASCGFWFAAASCGDWVRTMQHTYHALKIIVGIKDRSKHDQLILRYSEILARACLGYYRATRGPCQIHGEGDLTDCDKLCYLPEPMAVELRIADALCHIQKALARLEDCVHRLETRKDPHKQYARVLNLIQKQQRELRFLDRKWSDAQHLGMSPAVLAQAARIAPVTFSPFTPVHDALQNFIEGGRSQSTFGELELRMRVVLPNFMCATNQGHPALLTDTCTLLFATTIIEGRRRLENEPARKLVEQIVEDFEADADSPT